MISLRRERPSEPRPATENQVRSIHLLIDYACEQNRLSRDLANRLIVELSEAVRPR